ncbi:MAG: DsbA family protein [Alphaproteobacteria bacterium]|nr:DsbA family protein [Alphaproteobacteria bacterium]
MKKTKTIPETLTVTETPSCCSTHDCCCGSECHCHSEKTSGCGLKTVLMAASMWGSAFVIAGSILMSGGPSISPIRPIVTPKAPTPAVAPVATSDEAMKKFVEQNPKLIFETVQNYLTQLEKEARAAEEANPKMAPQEIIDEILADKSNYSLGNPNGKYVIIEFFDHKCGWCKKTNEALKAALAKPENKNIRWIPIDTPIFGEQSEKIARFVLAAGKQGKYAQMHDAVSSAKAFEDANFVEMGKKIGLDTDKLLADANSEELKAKLVKNQEYAGKLNINGVPMLIVNGRINPGALLGDRLEKALKEAQEMK